MAEGRETLPIISSEQELLGQAESKSILSNFDPPAVNTNFVAPVGRPILTEMCRSGAKGK